MVWKVRADAYPALAALDLDAEWDPAAHDAQMAGIYGGEGDPEADGEEVVRVYVLALWADANPEHVGCRQADVGRRYPHRRYCPAILLVQETQQGREEEA